jgi:erythromycin esterase
MKQKLIVSLILCISFLTLFWIFRPLQYFRSERDPFATNSGNSIYKTFPTAKKDTLDAIKRWIRHNAIPLQTVKAGSGFKDLQPLKVLIGSAHLVALGEATHGSREFFELKHRIMEFLVNEMGFTVFGIEASMPEAFYINDYILTGKGNPEKALASFYNWVWNTEEVLDMIKWMRIYNADPLHIKKVKFYGFDMQSASLAVKLVLQNVRKIDQSQAEVLEKPLAILANPFTAPDFVSLPKAKKEETFKAISNILRFLEEHKREFLSNESDSEWSIIHQHAVVVAQYIESKMNASGFINLDPAVRDKSMAGNIQWILNHEGAGTKMIIWAHNLHVATTTAMGSDLRKMYGNDMFVFGFAFNRGSFQASELPVGYNQYLLFPSGRGVHQFTVKPYHSETNVSLDRMLAESGLKYAAISLHSLPKEGPVRSWFTEGQLTRNIGSAYMNSDSTRLLKISFAQAYDALLFVENTTASHLNSSGQRSPATILTGPANTDFEEGIQGKTPIGWLVPDQSAAFGFSVTISENNPYTGKQCAVISRKPEIHYGEMYGSLSQQIDAAPYRGKKIRLRAAIRTMVSGPGNQAYLWLRVTKKFFGPAALCFYENMAEKPITNSKWKVYDIVGMVTPDADVIGFGLAMVGDGEVWIDSLSVSITN